MKKIFSVLLAILLLMSACTSAMAFSVSEELKNPLIDQTLLSEAFIYEQILQGTELPSIMANAILVGDTAYICLFDGSVYRMEEGADTAEKYCTVPARPRSLGAADYGDLRASEQAEVDEIFDLFVTDGDTLYTINTYTGRIGTISGSGIAWQDIRFDTTPFVTQEGWARMLLGAHVIGGGLYIMIDCSDESLNYETNNDIVKIDMATGDTKRLNLQKPLMFSPYSDGELLVLRASEEGEKVFSVYDIQTATSRDLPLATVNPNEEICGLAYDNAADKIMYSGMSGIYRSVNGAAFERVCPYPLDYVLGSIEGYILPDGRYALSSDGISIVNVDAFSVENTLTLALINKDNKLLNAFAVQHPNIIPDVTTERLSTADIATRIQGGDTVTDIFELRVDNTFGALKRKGFTADLTASPVLAAEAEQLYPAVRAALENEEGQLVAYPTHLDLNQWSVNTALWAKYFGTEAVPTTYSALLDAMLRFEDTTGPEDGELFLVEWSHENMVKEIITSFIRQSDTREKPLTFDAPELSLALDKLAQVNEMMLSKGITYQSEVDVYPYEDILFHSLFYSFGGGSNVLASSAKDIEEGGALPPFAFTDGQTPQYRGYMTVLIVNPNSAKKELAFDYIACAASQDSDIQRYYATHASATEPVEKADYQQKMDGYEKAKVDIEKQIAQLQASDPKSTDIASLQSDLDRVQWYLENADFVRYEITAPGIAAWQQIIPYANFYEDSLYIAEDESAVTQQINSLCAQYASGRFNTPDFLSKLTATLEMIYKE